MDLSTTIGGPYLEWIFIGKSQREQLGENGTTLLEQHAKTLQNPGIIF